VFSCFLPTLAIAQASRLSGERIEALRGRTVQNTPIASWRDHGCEGVEIDSAELRLIGLADNVVSNRFATDADALFFEVEVG
jgi:hypothetical protein